nr:Ig-like domain-containing protein [Gemmatimonadota bacterium]
MTIRAAYSTSRFAAAGGIALSLALWACSDSTGGLIPSKYAVTVARATAVVGDTVSVIAQLADSHDNPVRLSGMTASFSTNGSGHFTSPRGTTDANGVATTTYVSDTVTRDGIVITVLDQARVAGSSASLRIIAGETKQYKVTVSNSSPTAGSTITVNAQQGDRYGNLTKSPGRIVTWGLGPVYYDTPTGTFSSPTSTTNADGIATVDFIASTRAYTDYFIAAVDDQNASGYSATINTVAAPLSTYLVTTAVTDPPAGATVVLFAKAVDAYGNPLQKAGSPVNWSATGGGTLSSSMTTTDPAGTASVQLTTGSASGVSYVVTTTGPMGVTGTSPTITTQQQMTLASLSPRLGPQSSCGIASDGGVWCWGAQNVAPRTARPLPGKLATPPMSALTTGDAHGCGISGGKVFCWGYNAVGQLGDNSTASRDSPTPINSSLAFISVSAGESHTCALTTTQEIYCWGNWADGRLGDGGGSSGLSPVKVASTLAFAAVSAGGSHTCAITTSGDAYCWGLNWDGQLGNGQPPSVAFPVLVSGGLKFTAISAGHAHTCGIAGGNVYCWGSDVFGQIGDNRTTASVPTPTQVTASGSIVSIAAGAAHSCAVASGGNAYCWGHNTDGELGDPNYT